MMIERVKNKYFLDLEKHEEFIKRRETDKVESYFFVLWIFFFRFLMENSWFFLNEK
jgi:hypothetical protein